MWFLVWPPAHAWSKSLTFFCRFDWTALLIRFLGFILGDIFQSKSHPYKQSSKRPQIIRRVLSKVLWIQFIFECNCLFWQHHRLLLQRHLKSEGGRLSLNWNSNPGTNAVLRWDFDEIINKMGCPWLQLVISNKILWYVKVTMIITTIVKTLVLLCLSPTPPGQRQPQPS